MEIISNTSRFFTLKPGYFLGVAMFIFASNPVSAQDLPGDCGTLTRPWGPFDYRADRYIPETTYRSHDKLLAIVEDAHFTKEVELLIRGKTSAPPGGDIDYTLRAFPNHHRALLAMIALGEKTKSDKPDLSRFTVECWVRRGITWRPDDNIVRMIYAKYLIKANRTDEAIAQLQIATNNANNNAFTFRNIGLLYLELKKYDEALDFAHKAMALGLNIQALMNPLKTAGKWTEPATRATGGAAGTASGNLE